MLNISNNNINQKVEINNININQVLRIRPYSKTKNKIIGIVLFFFVLFLFLPWNQNIQGSGYVTTLKLDERPQTITTIIGGSIKKWYVNEGDFVKKGDTIMYITEVKEDYLDPNLIQNTQNQIDAKQNAVISYKGKVNAINNQLHALANENALKIRQTKIKIQQTSLKIKSDSIDNEAVKIQYKIAQNQYNRSLQLNKDGLKPLSDLEEKRLKLQDTEAKSISQQNKFLNAKNDLVTLTMELSRLQAEFYEKYSKSQSDQFTAKSIQYDTEAQVNKLKNQYNNYSIRNQYYYILAPQNGFINKAIKQGVGEVIKEGTPLVTIMPKDYKIAVETYIDPMDLPLAHKGEQVKIWFDGWPTIIFSGWPNMSYGTFSGEIVAIENNISDNNKYRVLIAPNRNKPWPKELQIGAGAKTFALLETVPIWYELWRQLNGFPPNFYKPITKEKK
jgi:multidrug efflux pump subunit AcrA (membrane-fusion protein)